jgi:hypothetical protein
MNTRQKAIEVIEQDIDSSRTTLDALMGPKATKLYPDESKRQQLIRVHMHRLEAYNHAFFVLSCSQCNHTK